MVDGVLEGADFFSEELSNIFPVKLVIASAMMLKKVRQLVGVGDGDGDCDGIVVFKRSYVV